MLESLGTKVVAVMLFCTQNLTSCTQDFSKPVFIGSF